jgi:2-phosphoglycerate kinase
MIVSPSWKVLLIGGHSGTGKTLVSRRLAHRYAVGLAEVDDFRLVLDRMNARDQPSALRALLKLVSSPEISADVACDALSTIADTVSYALEIVVANHVATDTPTILEGDGITPAFAAQRVFANRDVEDTVRSVFLIEEDEEQLYHNGIARGRGFDLLPRADQHRFIRLSWLYGQWLRQEAVSRNLPTVAPLPWDTLEDRIINAISAG